MVLLFAIEMIPERASRIAYAQTATQEIGSLGVHSIAAFEIR